MKEDFTNAQVNAFCNNWVQWCITRKYFIPPGAQNILARMQPQKVRQPPDAAMSADMAFFNMALHALADMSEHRDEAQCFVSFYCDNARHIKAVAAKMGIGRRTYYERVNRFARRALALMAGLKAAHLKATQDGNLPVAGGVRENTHI